MRAWSSSRAINKRSCERGTARVLLIHIADVEPARLGRSASYHGAACEAHVLRRSRPTALAQLSLSVRVCDYQPMQPLTNTREKVDWRLKR